MPGSHPLQRLCTCYSSHLSPPSTENLVPFQRPQGSSQSFSLGKCLLSQLSHHQPSIPPLGGLPEPLPRPTYFVTNSPSTRALPSSQLFGITFSYLLSLLLLLTWRLQSITTVLLPFVSRALSLLYAVSGIQQNLVFASGCVRTLQSGIVPALGPACQGLCSCWPAKPGH